MHSFSGGWELAREFLRLGLLIGIGGPVTFKNARRPVEVAKTIDLCNLVLETDCPYLSPEPFRGRRNEPARVRIVAEKIALERKISVAELAAHTTENARNLFFGD